MSDIKEADEIASIRYVIQLARTKGPDAIRKLAALLNSDNEKIVLGAANALLDRGFGKPAQTIQVSDNPLERAEELSDAELQQRLRRLERERAAERADPPPSSTH
jgi:hypothetical protein